MSKNAIVLIIDGLGTGCLGPYGISSGETEAFNRLASRSIVVDHAMTDSCESSAIYRTMMQGGHAGFSDDWYQNREPLPRLASGHGIHSTWFSDQRSCSLLPGADHFQKRVAFSQTLPMAGNLAAEVDDTWMARFFAEAIETLANMKGESNLAWIHCPGMAAAWDSPEEFRLQLVGPDDPMPSCDADPIAFQVEQDDPDKRFAAECAYAGQIAIVDLLLDAFMDTLDANLHDSLLIVAGHRPFPLGQHGVFGLEHPILQAEAVHIPMFARYPTSRENAKPSSFENHFRLQSIVQPSDLFATIADWFCLEADVDTTRSLGRCLTEPEKERREFAVAVNGNELALRTEHWFARCFAEPSEESSAWCQLYLKPDDRWNINDVADRCPQVVHDLQSLYLATREGLAIGDLTSVNVPNSFLEPVE